MIKKDEIVENGEMAAGQTVGIQSKQKTERAVEYFGKGFCCSQAVFTTFATEYGVPEDFALKIAAQFGGGARKGEMCGSVSGALMVLGLKYGFSDGNAQSEKELAHRKAEEFMNRFIEKKGTVVCRELLGRDLSKPGELERIRELGLFQSICPEMVRCAAEIVEEMMAENEQ
ncbi:MAG: C_GCAxxG_C_C family protein [Lachnospiraceae bacterium]|nr:C_GCAxxG_C_C family protein [Lachnospiraceae bacterium]